MTEKGNTEGKRVVRRQDSEEETMSVFTQSGFFFFPIFIVIQLQLYAFSPLPSPWPRLGTVYTVSFKTEKSFEKRLRFHKKELIQKNINGLQLRLFDILLLHKLLKVDF